MCCYCYWCCCSYCRWMVWVAGRLCTGRRSCRHWRSPVLVLITALPPFNQHVPRYVEINAKGWKVKATFTHGQRCILSNESSFRLLAGIVCLLSLANCLQTGEHRSTESDFVYYLTRDRTWITNSMQSATALWQKRIAAAKLPNPTAAD